MRLLLLASLLVTSAMSSAQDRFLDGVLQPGELTVQPKVRVKRVPAFIGPDLDAAEGQIRVEFVIERNGSVRQARLASGTGDTQRERDAVGAAKQCRFEPGSKDGKPVRSLAVLLVDFRKARIRQKGVETSAVRSTVVIEGADDAMGIGAVTAMTPKVVLPERLRSVAPEGVVNGRPLSGVAQIEVVVQADGTIGDYRNAGPFDPPVYESALKAIRQWQYSPATLNGKPVPFVTVLMVKFDFR